MNIGIKIRNARKNKKLTQAQLSRGIVTRNMLCAIESGTANPSLDTLVKIAERLEIPPSYFLSESDDVYFYKKSQEIDKILSALRAKNYKAVIERAEALGGIDDEIAYLLAYSYFKLAENSAKTGSFESAALQLNKFAEYKEKTSYDLSVEASVSTVYSALAKNIHAPLLEFEAAAYEKALGSIRYEYYKYLLHDFDYPYTTEAYAKHLKAKQLIRERKYADAITLLTQIVDNKSLEYDAYLIFGVYTDIENCYKQLYDFENAYRYSSKRLSLLEGFKS